VSGPLCAENFAHSGFSSLGVMFHLVKIYEVRVHLDDSDFRLDLRCLGSPRNSGKDKRAARRKLSW
jgi:hypothetical protein